MLTAQVLTQIEREFSGADVPLAQELVGRIETQLSRWKEVSRGDRVERATLTLARGDLGRLRDAVELAMRDWRDVLVAAGDA